MARQCENRWGRDGKPYCRPTREKTAPAPPGAHSSPTGFTLLPAPHPLPASLEPDIIHLDDALVIVNKPAGLLSVPGRGPERQDCVAARIQAQLADALIVHRLDMDTSGILLLARGAEMHRRMSTAFEQRSVGKRYVALAHAHLADEAGEIDLPMRCDWDNRPRQIVDFDQGRRALTRYRVLGRFGEGVTATTRVELEPVTGRSHQLRVHLQAIGHPILGDRLYAPSESAATHPRMYLHAARLSLIHPESRIPLVIDCPPAF